MSHYKHISIDELYQRLDELKDVPSEVRKIREELNARHASEYAVRTEHKDREIVVVRVYRKKKR